ncbi:MAG: hypothetical protein A2V98_03850 [Planctomycetes bacterium RBG_16_64_12]|nr:MAG: hypothetical protein A2V98_03850 [Planctomycetes bacterium RBG_16_64_12]
MTVALHEQLHAFAKALLEHRGALVDWPVADREGVALLPPDLATVLGTHDEMVRVTCEAGGQGISVDLAGDFLEWAGYVLESEPKTGVFRIRDPYLKRKDLDEGIARTFTWLNAKVRLREGRETRIEYHTWWFHGALASEDRWETSFAVSLNSASGVEVAIPDPLSLWELQPRPGPLPVIPSSYGRAAGIAKQRLLHLAAAFLDRMDTRLHGDRKRLRDYYHALLRETDKKKTRDQASPDPEKVQARKRAVDLELRRKLSELDERYAIDATLLPVALVRTEVPVLVVDLSVFRKQADKMHRIYWNPLLKQFDPMACSRCGEGAFAVAFTNEGVEPLCSKCSAPSGA